MGINCSGTLCNEGLGAGGLRSRQISFAVQIQEQGNSQSNIFSSHVLHLLLSSLEFFGWRKDSKLFLVLPSAASLEFLFRILFRPMRLASNLVQFQLYPLTRSLSFNFPLAVRVHPLAELIDLLHRHWWYLVCSCVDGNKRSPRLGLDDVGLIRWQRTG
jgi:hypothetical protein